MDLHQTQLDLKSRVAKGLNFGIEAVEKMLANNAVVYNDFILLKSQYNDLMHLSSINTLPYEQIELGLNKLRTHLLKIIDNIGEDDLDRPEVDLALKNTALPNRRTNFFKLLDIHFQNLASICYVELRPGDSGYSDEYRVSGREGIHNLYGGAKFRFGKKEQIKGDHLAYIQEYFGNYFRGDTGMFEVYFNNIKHLLAYVMEDEIDQPFFLNTLRSLFSRYELAFIFYYVLSGQDDAFKTLIRKSGLITDSIRDVLVFPEHWTYFE
ncbi:MAG: hypothetical protein DHS20C18_26740 [Saprospiraceae bacterium]|nr:MAG: hypothetical protein DHS20C18_26740 [Saprospiraceae bacterium]